MTADQIRDKSFPKGVRGYDTEKVRAYLAEIANRVHELEQENAQLRTVLAGREAGETAGDIDGRLRRMLKEMETTAARIVEQSKTNVAAVSTQAEHERHIFLKNAREEAQVIIRDAEKRAESIVLEANRKSSSILEEIGLLHSRRLALIARIKSLLISQTEFLKALEEDVKDPMVQRAPVRPKAGDPEGLDAADLQSIIEKLQNKQDSAE